MPRVLPGRVPGSSRESRLISNPQFQLCVRAEKVFHRRNNMPSLRHCRINTHSLRRCLAKILSLMNRPCCAFIAMLLAVLQSTWSFKAFGVLCDFIRSHVRAFIRSVLSVVCCCRSPVASCPSLSAHPFACFLSVSIVIIVPLVVVIATIEGKQGPVQSLCAKNKGWDVSLRGSGLSSDTKRTRLGIESDIWGAWTYCQERRTRCFSVSASADRH